MDPARTARQDVLPEPDSDVEVVLILYEADGRGKFRPIRPERPGGTEACAARRGGESSCTRRFYPEAGENTNG